MSQNQVQAFINRMKNDGQFRQDIISCTNIEERINRCKVSGYNISQEDILSLMLNYEKKHSVKKNLPNTWLCKGPCHTQCTDISLDC